MRESDEEARARWTIATWNECACVCFNQSALKKSQRRVVEWMYVLDEIYRRKLYLIETADVTETTIYLR